MTDNRLEKDGPLPELDHFRNQMDAFNTKKD